MKKIFLLFLISVFSFNFYASAQKSVVKFNPVSLIFGVGKATYENVLNEGSSVELSLTYSNFDLGIFGKATGIGFQGKYKIYFADEAPDGWYVAPAVSYSHTKWDGGEAGLTMGIIGGAALIGHQWVFGNGGGFTIDINTGAGYNLIVADDPGTSTVDGIGYKGNISFGWAF